MDGSTAWVDTKQHAGYQSLTRTTCKTVTRTAPAGAGHHEPVPGAEGGELLSEERLRWLDGLEWAAVGRCPYSTIETPKGAMAQFQETQGPDPLQQGAG